MRKILVISLISLFLGGCSYFSLYKPDIQQGNYLSSKKVNQLRLGLLKFQVIKLMGTPVLDDTFTGNQIAYVYMSKLNHEKLVQKRVVLTFRGNKLIRIQKDLPVTKSD